MTLKKIITLPDPFLRTKAKPVKEVTKEIRELLDDMLETMYHANGIGLASTQIKDNRRLIVMDCGIQSERHNDNKEKELDPNPIKMINPVLMHLSSDLVEREEGCLSIPGHQGKVKRPKFVKVSYIDENEVKKEFDAEGMLATCIQHEIDHLNGVLFIDYLSRLKKEMIIKKITKEYNNTR